MHKLPTVANLVGDPPLVHFNIVARLHAIDHAFIVLHANVVATCGNAVNTWGFLQKPNALLKEKIFVKQRAHGANINHIAAEFIVQRDAWENINLLNAAAAIHHQLAGARDLAREANATRAHDATIAVQQNMRANIFLGTLVLGFFETTFATTILITVILQMTLARLIAHGAIHRMIDEQKFHDGLLIADRLGRIGVHHLAFNRRRLTRWK